MLRRLETMVLMTGYQLPLRAIREQIASAVDLIVHTARLKDGSRKIVNITEVYGIEDDEILTQDIFTFVQTGYQATARSKARSKPTGIRPTFMGQFTAGRRRAAARRVRHPARGPGQPDHDRKKSRFGARTSSQDRAHGRAGRRRRTVVAGGMVYVSSIGPVDPETGQVVTGSIKEQTRLCMANLKDRLEAAGSSLEKVVWANWSLKDPTDFDEFNEEWIRWFPADAPLGQLHDDAAASAAGRLPGLARGDRAALAARVAGEQPRYGLQKPMSPSRATGGSPSGNRTVSWVDPSGSASGRRNDELSGAQIRWLRAYWSK